MSKEQLFQMGGQTIYELYEESIYQLLCNTLPEYYWISWKFKEHPSKFWRLSFVTSALTLVATCRYRELSSTISENLWTSKPLRTGITSLKILYFKVPLLPFYQSTGNRDRKCSLQFSQVLILLFFL